MAELGVIGLMISSTATAAGVLGVIKRRCGASERIVALTEKCASQVYSIKELLQTLEEGTNLPYDARSITTALNQRCSELKAIEKQLGKVNRRTKRASRTERFTLAQGWVIKLEGIYNDLQIMRQDVQQLVVNWESRRFVVTAIHDTMTIDATRNADRQDGTATWASDNEESDVLVSANNADRIFLTGVKLSLRDWKALSRYGRMDELSLPDALLETSNSLREFFLELDFRSSRGFGVHDRALQYSRHSNRLLRLAAELQHPIAHLYLGWRYWNGIGTEIDLDSSILHYKIALDSGKKNALFGLSRAYRKLGDLTRALKYMTRAAEHDIILSAEVILLLTMDAGNVHNVEEARKWFNRCPEPLFQSFCLFFGIGVQRSEMEAVLLVERLKIDDSEYRVAVEKERGLQISWISFYGPNESQLPRVLYQFQSYVGASITEMIGEWFDHLFDRGLQSEVVGQLQAEPSLFTRDLFECYTERAVRDGSVVGHLALASDFAGLHRENQNWRRAEQHLRIAAEMGHSDAQEVCRELFGDTEKPSRGIKNPEEEIEHQRRALHNLSMSGERTLSQ